MEMQDEDLKKKSMNWWSNHSQDYVDPGENAHLGIDTNIGDDEFLKIINKNDKNFYLDACFAHENNKRLFSSLIPEKIQNKKILEIGCGLGAHTEELIRYKAKVTSIDIAPKSVEITRRRLKLKGLLGNVLEADAENLPFPDNYFDYIWSWGVIHHSPDTKKCAQEIERVLSPKGKLYIMLYHRNSLYNWMNVIFRYGVLRGKLLKMSIQDLHNRYTDGKSDKGAPLSKYYTAKQIRQNLFPNFKIISQKTMEQKHAFSFWVPKTYRRKFESLINNKFYSFIWSKFGFLIFTIAQKK